MTAAAKQPFAEYQGDGGTVTFAAKFRFNAPDHVKVRQIAADGAVADLAYGVDYNVGGGATDAGGTVTLAVAPADGARIQIRRVTPRVQAMNYATADTFPAESHEAAIDKAMLVDQEQDVAIDDVTGRALMVPVGEQAAELPLAASRAGRFMGFDPLGNAIMLQGTGNDPDLRADLASVIGGAMLGTRWPGIGGVIRSIADKLFDILDAKDFGAIGHQEGDVDPPDDTDAIKALWAAMRATGRPGRLGAAFEKTRYLVRKGELEWTFTNDGTVPGDGVCGPMLYTSGLVTLVSAAHVDAPFIAVHSDPDPDATDDHGPRFIQGGFIEALCFEDTTVGGTANQSFGLELYGVNNMRFGAMVSMSAIRGDVIRITKQGDLMVGSGDFWHVFGCQFDGATIWNSPYYALNNDSDSQYFNNCRIGSLWALHAAGALRGCGASNRFESISAGWCSNWAADVSAWGSSVQGCEIGTMEIDAPRYGVRFSGVQFVRVGFGRIIYRNGDNPSGASVGVPAGTTWPEKAIEFTATEVGRVITKLDGLFFHRFEISSAQLPATIADYTNNVDHRDIAIEHRITSLTDHPAAPSPGLFAANINGNALGVMVRLNDTVIHDNRLKTLLIARCGAAAGHTSTSYDGSDPVAYTSVERDQVGILSGDGKTVTLPAKAIYGIRVRHLVQPNAGDRVRLGVFHNGVLVREQHEIMADGRGIGEEVPRALDFLLEGNRGDTLKACLYEAQERDLMAGSAGLAANNYIEIIQL